MKKLIITLCLLLTACTSPNNQNQINDWVRISTSGGYFTIFRQYPTSNQTIPFETVIYLQIRTQIEVTP